MQPQAPIPPTPGQQPAAGPSPNPQYDFILKDPQKPKGGFGVPKLPKPAFILGGSIGLILIFLVLTSVLRGNKGNDTQYLDVVGRAQEIARVSTNIVQQSQDPDTQYLAETAQITLTSEQKELTTYLAKHKIKISPKQLLTYKDSKTDTELQTAQQNNHLEATYDNYLKTSLSVYRAALRTANVGATKERMAILSSAYASTQVLLEAPELTPVQ